MQLFGHNRYGTKLGLCPFGEGELGQHLRAGSASNTIMAGAEAYLHAKFHLDPKSNRLATVHQRYRQTDRQDRTTVRQQCEPFLVDRL